MAGTPPGNNMAVNGLGPRKPYPLVVDTRVDSSAVAMMNDVATGEIDAGILWDRWPAITRGRRAPR